MVGAVRAAAAAAAAPGIASVAAGAAVGSIASTSASASSDHLVDGSSSSSSSSSIESIIPSAASWLPSIGVEEALHGADVAAAVAPSMQLVDSLDPHGDRDGEAGDWSTDSAMLQARARMADAWAHSVMEAARSSVADSEEGRASLAGLEEALDAVLEQAALAGKVPELLAGVIRGAQQCVARSHRCAC